MLTRAGGALALSLFCATAAFGAPATNRHSRAHRTCSQRTYVHKPPRHAKSFGGPLAHSSTPHVAGLTDLTALLKRGLRANLPDDDEAIQNDVPAARIDVDTRQVPVLLPLGLLPRSFDTRLSTHSYSRRSPRGPPTSA